MCIHKIEKLPYVHSIYVMHCFVNNVNLFIYSYI